MSAAWPDSAPSRPPRPERPPRPAAVELVAAFMIVTGLVSTVTSIQFAMEQANAGADPGLAAILSVALGIGSVVLGVLVRYGRAWLLTVNVITVLGFLELLSATSVGLLFGALDVATVLVLVWQRPWFAWVPGAAGDREPR